MVFGGVDWGQTHLSREFVIRLIIDWVAQPSRNGRFPPPCTSRGNPYLPRERTILDLSVQRRSAETGSVEDAVEA